MAQASWYYRPEWTLGRYDKKHKAAIFYNLIEGMSYFLEDESADVVGIILAAGRNGKFSIEQIAESTGIAEESIVPFIEELCRLNLVTDSLPTPEGIASYRKAVAEWKKKNPPLLDKKTEEKLPFDISNSEMEYTNRVGGVTSVMLEMTYRCSEKCIHCYNIGATRNDEEESHRGDLDEMTLDDYKRLIDELYEQGLYKVCLSGGDPFSKNITWELIDYLYNKEIAFDIFTNGQNLIGKEERLASYYPRLVGVSIYSSDPAVHDYITRIPGSWEKSMTVVNRLGDLSVPMNIKCCVMRPNVKSYRGVAEIARSVGAQPQFEINVSDSIEGDKCVSHYLRLTPEQYEIVLRDDNVPQYVGPEAPNFGGQKRPMDQNCCGAGENSFCITPDGFLIPCCSFHLEFGNVKNEKLSEILKSPKLEKWQKTVLSDYEECGKHEYCDYCNLCPGHGQSEHGNYLKASENCCHVAKIRHELAHKMMEGYDPLEGKTIDIRMEDFECQNFIKLNRIL